MILKFFSKNKKIVLAGIVFLLSLFFYSNSVLAQTTYNALVTIPGIPPGAKVQVYLSGLYTFLISVVGIVAMGAIVIGGARYLTSAGNPSAIEDAKYTINSAIYGLLLAITSWVIINTINPDILVLKNPAMPWSAVGYSPTGPTPQCALATGSPTSGCACVDNPAVPVLGVTPFPPYVVGSSFSACALNVSTATASVAITFSEPMKASTLTAANITMLPTALTVAPDPGNASVAIATFSPALAAAQDYQITVGTGVQNVAGTPMTASYPIRFTTNATFATACVPPLSGTGCNRVCSDSSLAQGGAYHCLKADLRAGSAPNPTGKSITIKSGEAVYFDGRTFSADGTYPGLNTGAPSNSDSFENGIRQYEICFDAGNLLSCNLVLANYGCADNLFTPCAAAWVLGGKVDSWMPCGMAKNIYTATTPTTFRARLRVISKNDCLTRYENEVVINVNP